MAISKQNIDKRIDDIDTEIRQLRSSTEHESIVIEYLIIELKCERKEILEQWYEIDN